MTRSFCAARLIPCCLLATSLVVWQPALAQQDGSSMQEKIAQSTYDKAMEQAQRATDRTMEQAQRASDQAQALSDAAMREAEDAIAGIDADNLATEMFASRELGSAREIVKNAPYTAQAVTETIQTLTDGNRIVHRSVTFLARDSVGRTRQEKRTERGGTAYVYDPVENRSFVLRTDGKTAVQLPRAPLPPVPPTPPTPPSPPAVAAPPARGDSAPVAVQPGRVVVRRSNANGSDDDIHVEVIRVGREDESGGSDTPVQPIPPLPPMPPLTMRGHPLPLPYGHSERGVTESLGSRDFDGIRADGKRTTRMIPAGAIGNEKPIAIVSERWFSPDLNIVVMNRTIDPRSGETVYRLTDIKRSEPSADLFRVPADYKVRDRGSHSR